MYISDVAGDLTILCFMLLLKLFDKVIAYILYLIPRSSISMLQLTFLLKIFSNWKHIFYLQIFKMTP